MNREDLCRRPAAISVVHSRHLLSVRFMRCRFTIQSIISIACVTGTRTRHFRPPLAGLNIIQRESSSIDQMQQPWIRAPICRTNDRIRWLTHVARWTSSRAVCRRTFTSRLRVRITGRCPRHWALPTPSCWPDSSPNTPIKHEHVDALPPGRITNHVREMPVTTGVLPRRQEPLARLQSRPKDVPDHLAPQQRRPTVAAPDLTWKV